MYCFQGVFRIFVGHTFRHFIQWRGGIFPFSRRTILFLVSLSFTISRPLAAAPVPTRVLTVDDYLGQVERADPGYQGMLQAQAATVATSAKAALLFHPQFFTHLEYTDDTRDTQAPAIQGTSVIRRNAAIGVKEQTPYGLGVQLSVNVDQSSLFNTDPNLVLRPNLTNIYIVPMFNLSLWSNLLGRADRANRESQEAQDKAAAYGKAYEARATLVQAEAAYWKLAVLSEICRMQKESVERARELLEFDERRARKSLVDATDLLLAQSAAKGKELELRSMEDERHAAASAFNSARGIVSDEVAEQLRLPPPETLQRLDVLGRGERRLDTRAAEQALLAQEAGSRLAREKLLPELSVYGSIYSVGLNFGFPLDFSSTSAIRQGYAQQAAAADLTYQRKLMNEASEWTELVRKFQSAKDRLGLAVDLEKIQRAKFEAVRARRVRGLTVEAQVFQYELDYLSAGLARVQLEGAILGLRSQMKLYAAGER